MPASTQRRHRHTLPRGGLIACILAQAMVGSVLRGDEFAPSDSSIESDRVELVGMTTPSQSARLAAVLPARISRILCEEGATVGEGQLLVALDDEIQRARTELAKAAAESDLRVGIAHVRWAEAKREWERLAALHGDDYASSRELNRAYAEAEAKRLELELARHVHEQDARTYERERAQWAEYFIRAPFNGYVAEHLKEVGEAVDQLEPIVSVASLDPLHVVLDCPIGLAGTLQEGARLEVRPVDGRWGTRTGTVIFTSLVADGASQTFRVKLSVPNEDHGWPSGLKIAVGVSPAKPGTVVSGVSPGESVVDSKSQGEAHEGG